MMHLYLDESGCLGFDFNKAKTSKNFTITILAIGDSNRDMSYAIKKTLKRKINLKKSKRIEVELKGSKTSLEVKEYFYKQISSTKFNIYSITLNKARVHQRLRDKQDRLYNFITRLIVDKIPLQNESTRVIFTLDKCKGKPEIINFNKYIEDQIKSRLDPKVPLDIVHGDSQKVPGLQAVDLFCWGIYRKYESADRKWYNIFKSKIIYDKVYLPNKKNE